MALTFIAIILGIGVTISLFAYRIEHEYAEERRQKRSNVKLLTSILQDFFEDVPSDQIVVSRKVYQPRSRIDLNRAMTEIVFEHPWKSNDHGFEKKYSHEEITLGSLLSATENDTYATPIQYEEVFVGNEYFTCFRNNLSFYSSGKEKFCCMVFTIENYSGVIGVVVEFAAKAGSKALEETVEISTKIEEYVKSSSFFKSKVIKLYRQGSYDSSSYIEVLDLPLLNKDQLILPNEAMRLLESTVFGFCTARKALNDLGFSKKKGILFHGPPGTGKTHALGYIKQRFPEFTLILVSADSVGMLDECVSVAKLLQPSIVAIEDVDLFAEDRDKSTDSSSKVVLQSLLNEIDGVASESEIIFILTTNRPQVLESALVSRPGRVDQAIEFPLPDKDCRTKLIKLYSGDLEIHDDLIDDLALRTEGKSGAFIKELIRRSAQIMILEGCSQISKELVDMALQEMIEGFGKYTNSIV